MPLNLNKLSDPTVHQDVQRNRERLSKFLSAEPSSPMRSDPIRYSRRLAECSLELGLELYQQEESVVEIRESLARAGENFLTALSLQGLSTLEFEQALALAEVFCPRSVYQNVDKIQEKKFYDPSAYENADKNFIAMGGAKHLQIFAILAQYLNLLRQFIASGVLDQGAWIEIENLCLKPNASRYDAKVNLSKLRALKSIANKDAHLLNEALGILVQEHESEARHGENQKSTRGFVSLPALMFAHLGESAGLKCTVQSPYLPLQLLKH